MQLCPKSGRAAAHSRHPRPNGLSAHIFMNSVTSVLLSSHGALQNILFYHLINQTDIPKNLTSNLNKNGHNFNPKLRPLSVKIKVKNCITGKKKNASIKTPPC